MNEQPKPKYRVAEFDGNDRLFSLVFYEGQIGEALNAYSSMRTYNILMKKPYDITFIVL